MKLLFENWREYLKEEAQTLETLPEDQFIYIDVGAPGGQAPNAPPPPNINIYLLQNVDPEKIKSMATSGTPFAAQSKDYRLGRVFLSREASKLPLRGEAALGDIFEKVEAKYMDNLGFDYYDELSDAQLEEIDDMVDQKLKAIDASCNFSSWEKLYTIHSDLGEVQGSGYGPLIWDIAIELATQNNSMVIPYGAMNWTKPTPAAEKIYEYYYNNRSDVTKTPLLRPSQQQLQLSLGDDDNCWWYFSGNPDFEEWQKSAPWMTVAYSKEPTILNSEFAKNKIIWG